MSDVRNKGTDEKFCFCCGEIIKLAAEICPKCGARVTRLEELINDVRSKGSNEKFCFSCGERIKLEAEICPKCGVRQITYFETPTSDSSSLIFWTIFIIADIIIFFLIFYSLSQ